MSQDNNDDPFAPPKDATIFRPRPGAGKRGPDRPASPEPPRASAEPQPSAPPAPPGRAPSLAALADFTGRGLNPLVQAASPLLILMGRLRTSLSNADIGGLRRQSLEQIREFEERARAAGVAPETTLAARYVLCSAID
ncbi:MAG TPA: type IVB secretion system protein IcmH/DotU, partial [Steroidobacteraceae bacterium]|nr:type IVB secretion system protein IcmH/DotU [Steroidobacteraceae bacterium]